MNSYISIIFVNRNDNYGGDQEKRINSFIDYYAHYDKMYPNLFEVLVCDWNPPKDKAKLALAYPWKKFSNIKHFVVDASLHKKLCPDNSRPILDYIGRNVCIRRAESPFVLIINQDIFLSSSIIHLLAKRNLNKKYFYRGDRYDFSLDFSELKAGEDFNTTAFSHTHRVHMRPNNYTEKMSVDVDKNTLKSSITQKKMSERLSKKNIIYGNYSKYLRLINRTKNFFFPPQNDYANYKQYYLHTNASGDFLLASKEAFEKIHGFVETHEFYMQLDGYACIQLFVSGCIQAIFSYPHAVFHLDHSRAERESRAESLSYQEHVKIFSKMCDSKTSYQLNGKDWGLINYDLNP